MRPILLLSLSLSAAFAQPSAPDYFPLQTGNQWVLETPGSTPSTLHIEVHRSRVFNGQQYFLVSGYAPGDEWLRKSSDGVVWALDPNTGSERRLAHLTFGAPQYVTTLGGCQQFAQPAEVSIAVVGPQRPGLPVNYAAGACRDVGISQEMYADGVGLMSRTVITLAGPRIYNLAYARVKGVPLTGQAPTIIVRSDFAYGAKGWSAGFSDYGLDNSDLRMVAEVRPLPEELGDTWTGFYLQGMNRSDDMFMFLKKEVTAAEGLKPNTAYWVMFDIDFASNTPDGCVGVGGSPGDGVYLKAGASADEPVSVLDPSRHLTMNVDKGNQSTGGRDAGVVSTIANGRPCELSATPYVPLRKSYTHPSVVRTDDRGVLWLMVGTDSAFEGLTGLYYTAISARIIPAGAQQ